MAKIKPFRAVRYNSEKFKTPLASPPYDIINEQQREELAREEYNMINLDKPGQNTDADRYNKAASRYKRWKTDSVLIQDDTPSFYIYVQRFFHPEQRTLYERTGFFTLVKLESFYENAVFPHERTLSAPKVDRLNLMEATEANFSPVFGLYDDLDNKADAIFKTIKEKEPLYNSYKDNDGTEHLLWRISHKEHIDTFVEILRNQKIIIADGHHRYETALNYSKKMKSQDKDKTGEKPYEYVLMCLVNFSDAGLVILPTHRLFNIETPDIIKKLDAFFSVQKHPPEVIENTLLNGNGSHKSLGFYGGKDKGSYILSLKDLSLLDGIVPASSSQEWRQLEVNLLYYVILKNVINISNEDFENKISYSHSFSETFAAVDAGRAECAFLLPPCTKEELERVTSAHEVMPQKSTYFIPKIFSGFVIYDHGI